MGRSESPTRQPVVLVYIAVVGFVAVAVDFVIDVMVVDVGVVALPHELTC